MSYEPSPEVDAALSETRHRLEEAYAQLNRYAADLNAALQKSIENELDVTRANRQLHIPASLK